MTSRCCRVERQGVRIRIYALEGGAIVAGLEGEETTQGIDISVVFVKPERRGRGLARGLIDALRAHFPQRRLRWREHRRWEASGSERWLDALLGPQPSDPGQRRRQRGP